MRVKGSEGRSSSRCTRMAVNQKLEVHETMMPTVRVFFLFFAPFGCGRTTIRTESQSFQVRRHDARACLLFSHRLILRFLSCLY